MPNYLEKFEKMRVAGNLAARTLDMLTELPSNLLFPLSPNRDYAVSTDSCVKVTPGVRRLSQINEPSLSKFIHIRLARLKSPYSPELWARISSARDTFGSERGASVSQLESNESMIICVRI